MRFLTFAVLLSAVIVPVVLPAEPAPAPLTLRFSTGTISVEGVTAGGKVVWFGVARELTATTPPVRMVVRHSSIVADSDRDGVVQLELAKGVPEMAMWAVVDLSSGRHASMPTPGYEPQRIDFTPELTKKDNAGQLRKLEWPFAEMELLLVRPGEGAWRLSAAKNSARDENRGKPDALRLDVEALIAIGDGPPAPKDIRNGDILALMDPRWMQYGILEVGK